MGTLTLEEFCRQAGDITQSADPADVPARIADALDRAPGDILFLSDVVAELDAAREAGLRTTLVDRREDYPEPRSGDACHGHPRVTTFDAVDVG